MSAAELRAARVIERTAALMAEKFQHDTPQALLEAFSEMGERDYEYFKKSIPLGAEKFGNALLNISFGYWERRAKEEAERQIAAEWDSCQCHGFGCRHCTEHKEFEVAPC